MERIKLLCVGSNCFPPKSGGEQALFNAYKALQDIVDLHLVVICNDLSELDGLKKSLNKTHIHSYTKKKDRFDVALSVTKRLTRYVFKLFGVSKEAKNRVLDVTLDLPDKFGFFKEINHYIEEYGVDVVQFEFIDWIFGSQAIISNCKKVFVHHEIMHIADLPRLPQNRTDDEWLNYSIKKNREIIGLNSYDAIITLSEDDKIRLEKAGVRTQIFPSFAQVSPLPFVPEQYKGSGNIVFMGPESHIPNRNGLLWFLNNVWPQVLRERPSTKLYIVGRWSQESLVAIQSNYGNVIFKGFVENLYEAIKDKIMIVPIREGSGLRMKILDAINMGVPFVACEVGAEGLKFKNGIHGYITDDSDIFATYVLELISHSGKCIEFVNNSREHIASEFSNEMFVQSRMNCYNSLLNR